ncbi:UDP-N-acetylglucosamine--LPS N-acetylglucosamine transferase [Litorivicinus lipolyticus]|uniref:UDP-N-acetylglucosamine--LPS N-acetylglucosamine transferase n=1 Tax=Litorivicinus lipolyticus TaxID=418701 RepID=A0A5Q2Q7U4_9GAMM|nr:UDP-N-acetylglucosamine--LPS N-acetylglucosamine transferase [Litorivicinus lipolyticus]QGG80128.1 UDP-N-acetylglucosamine--LPS N-acetylglucosamine transferase [Litorivicinus lipolyticus]
MRVLLVSSSGGHWVELMRTRQAFAGHQVLFASTERAYAADNPDAAFYYLPDASRWSKFRLAVQALACAWLILRTRPDVVVTTGASAGFFCLVFAKALRKRTVWLDSIANCSEISMSGRKAQPYADLYLTQWPELVESNGPSFHGALL